jgi:hypothetical protein
MMAWSATPLPLKNGFCSGRVTCPEAGILGYWRAINKVFFLELSAAQRTSE